MIFAFCWTIFDTVMVLADFNIAPATSATSLEYKHHYIKFRETNMHCFFYFFAVTKPQKIERKSLSKKWAALSKPHLLTYSARHSCCRNQIRIKHLQGHSFNVVTGALQGALLIPLCMIHISFTSTLWSILLWKKQLQASSIKKFNMNEFISILAAIFTNAYNFSDFLFATLGDTLLYEFTPFKGKKLLQDEQILCS